MKYALALGGGGTRGAFEVGVWEALCELGKEITAVAGTSVGAINGAAFVSGADARRLWLDMRADMLVPDAVNDGLLSVGSLTRGIGKMLGGGWSAEPLCALLKQHINESVLRGSGIDYGLCIYSVDEKQSAELFIDRIPEGRLSEYITASACFPLFKPVTIDGENLTDGGMRNNLPVNMLINRGCDTIIAVSVHGPGMLKDIDRRGVNIIKIESSAECGLMEFNREKIERSIRDGYYACMREFGRYSGEYFYINADSYSCAVSVYGSAFVEGIERAARLAGVERYREYSFSELAGAVVKSYESCAELDRLVRLIEKNPPCFMHSHLELKKNFDAANAIVYLQRRQKNL